MSGEPVDTWELIDTWYRFETVGEFFMLSYILMTHVRRVQMDPRWWRSDGGNA